MLKTFITIFMLGVLVSFHESMGVLALIPLGVCATMVAIGLALERRQQRRVSLTKIEKWGPKNSFIYFSSYRRVALTFGVFGYSI